MQLLFHNGFSICGFKEICTVVKPKRANKESGKTVLRRSRYTSLFDKKLKEFATKEIPMFLVVSAKLLKMHISGKKITTINSKSI